MSKKDAPTEAPRKGATTDPTLRLAAKLDRLLAEIPAAQRKWALAWLNTKYGVEPEQADPCV